MVELRGRDLEDFVLVLRVVESVLRRAFAAGQYMVHNLVMMQASMTSPRIVEMHASRLCRLLLEEAFLALAL